MKRREFLGVLGGAAAWPVAARAQQPTMPMIGYLASNLNTTLIAAWRHGLSETGYVEGKNVHVEYRSADGQNDRLPALASDLMRHKPAVIVASGNPAILAAKVATIPFPLHYDASRFL
jgi:putative tryptophan/tyrosine transport system substrate-binding protein